MRSCVSFPLLRQLARLTYLAASTNPASGLGTAALAYRYSANALCLSTSLCESIEAHSSESNSSLRLQAPPNIRRSAALALSLAIPTANHSSQHLAHFLITSTSETFCCSFSSPMSPSYGKQGETSVGITRALPPASSYLLSPGTVDITDSSISPRPLRQCSRYSET